MPPIDTSRPHSARVYDYWLNGKNNYEADAVAAERVARIWPGVKLGAQLNRAFMRRATRWLAAEAGVRQFLDIGTGIPTEPNLHQVAQSVAPDSRVVYADNDPIVLQYAQALLTSSLEGRTAYVHADVTEPEQLLESPELRETLDLGRPVALSMIALLHFLTDERGAYDLVRRLLDPLPSGSYLVLTHATADFDPDLLTRVSEAYQSTVTEGQIRSNTEVARFFEGLELLDPGLVVCHRWRPDPSEPQPDITDAELSVYAGVARKP
ncbi:SAM-dependent methyltransferase [Streptomyces sp. HNM0574]|nr:SAM-dependent methyltransferase [Streptomyces sp. HNM0574]